jgi:PAS domain S-box-containing protein
VKCKCKNSVIQSGIIINDYMGNPIFTSVTSIDRTEKKQQEIYALENEKIELSNSFRYLFDFHSAVMLLINPDTNDILDANFSASHFYGYSRSELQKMKITGINILSPEEVKIELELAINEKRNYFNFIHKLSNGELIPVEVHSTPILFNGGKILFSIIHDISERKKNEELVKLYTNKLKRMNSDLESFAYVASHDLKAPLNVVNVLIELLINKNSTLETEKQNDYYQLIKNSVNQMKNLISELLQFSLIGNNTDSFVEMDLNDLLLSIQGVLADTILQNKAEFIIHSLPVVKANSTLLNELFMNLVGNALKYHKSEKPLLIEIGYMENRDNYEFYVKDNGIGISPENFEKVFIMFKRLNAQSDFKGTGIGLALCKKIVESHSGEIWVESVFGDGSTFYFTIKKFI